VIITIDKKEVEAKKSDTILMAAKRAGIYIPSLCHHDALEDAGVCRLCMVEVNHAYWNSPKMVTACEYKVEPGLIVKTSTPDVDKSRRISIDLLLAKVPGSAVLLKISQKISLKPLVISKDSHEADNNKGSSCISCYLCTRVCQKMGCNAISMVSRGVDKRADAPYSVAPDSCTGCGACALICPVDYIKVTDTDNTRTIWNRDFDLVKCEVCGKGFMTEKYRDYAVNNRDLSADYYTKCPECKRAETAAKFSSIGVLKG